MLVCNGVFFTNFFAESSQKKWESLCVCNQCVPGPFLGALVATRLGSAGNVVQGIQFIANFIFKDTHLSEVILWLLQMVSVKILIKVVTCFLIQHFLR